MDGIDVTDIVHLRALVHDLDWYVEYEMHRGEDVSEVNAVQNRMLERAAKLEREKGLKPGRASR